MLDTSNLAKVRRSIGEVHSEEQGFLFVLIDLCTKRFMNSESIEQTMTALKSKLDLMAHKIDLHYTFLRYIIWVIPTVGFIGTVLGISFAILGINPVNLNLESVVAGLGVAFHTTLVSLILSALLNLIYNLVSSAEENALNKAGSYVLNNMVNRLDPSLDQTVNDPALVMKVPSISRG
ncbi:MAG: MotA/TolQ/ExbB proton channel family protein [Deinococcales bacterium]